MHIVGQCIGDQLNELMIFLYLQVELTELELKHAKVYIYYIQI